MHHHPDPIVTTAQGAVRGLRRGGTTAFRPARLIDRAGCPQILVTGGAVERRAHDDAWLRGETPDAVPGPAVVGSDGGQDGGALRLGVPMPSRATSAVVAGVNPAPRGCCCRLMRPAFRG
nr:hypothetical protein StreXyl84_68970 [Streptomyces sp. Xyl84]